LLKRAQHLLKGRARIGVLHQIALPGRISKTALGAEIERQQFALGTPFIDRRPGQPESLGQLRAGEHVRSLQQIHFGHRRAYSSALPDFNCLRTRGTSASSMRSTCSAAAVTILFRSWWRRVTRPELRPARSLKSESIFPTLPISAA